MSLKYIHLDIMEVGTMDKLNELETVLSDIEFLADTFGAMDIVNQINTLDLPRCALTVPAEILKRRAERARELQNELLKEFK